VPFDHPRRGTDGGDMVGDVLDDDRTGADDGTLADLNPLDDARSLSIS